jgi:hypothetical protein
VLLVDDDDVDFCPFMSEDAANGSDVMQGGQTGCVLVLDVQATWAPKSTPT